MAATVGARDRQRWRTQGIEALAPGDALEVLSDLMTSDATHVAVLPGRSRSRDSVVGSAEPSPARTLAAELLALPPTRRRGALVAHVREQVAHVLGLAPADIALERGLREMGMDSLMAVELRNRLQAGAGQPLPTTLAFDHPTVEAITAFLAAQVPALGVEAARVEGGNEVDARGQLVVEVGRMSDAEAEAALLRELDALAGGTEGRRS
jgi:myxalamid-type polyketide synthase MxaE and MxaD